MSFSAEDAVFMARAIRLAKKGQFTTHPNPRVGCVIVQQGTIIGEGYHQKAGSAHAEVNALSQCSVNQSTQGATVYVTLEPCSHTGKTPPCANALIEARVARVVIAMQDPNPQVAGQGIQRLHEAGISVDVGLQQIQAEALNPGFIKRMQSGLPWVRLKMAMSLDGRTAMASGESQWITGPEARHDVQRLRARADAILTGSGTVLADDPSLNVRISSEQLALDQGLEYQQPLRVVIDSHLRTSPQAKMLQLAGTTQIFTRVDDPKKQQALEQAGASVVVLDNQENDAATHAVPLAQALQHLGQQQINEVHVEAGAVLCGALLQQKLVDEIIIYMAPCLMGNKARGLFDLPFDHMSDKLALKINEIRKVGEDWRLSVLPE